MAYTDSSECCVAKSLNDGNSNTPRVSDDAHVEVLPPKNDHINLKIGDPSTVEHGDHTSSCILTLSSNSEGLITPTLILPVSITSQMPPKPTKEQREFLKEKKRIEKAEIKAKREVDRLLKEQERQMREEEKRERQKQREKEMEERKKRKEWDEKMKNMRKEKREAERKQREEERQRLELEKEQLQKEKLRKADQAKMKFMSCYGIKSVPIKKNRVVDETILTPFSVKSNMTLAKTPCLPLQDKSELDLFLSHQSSDYRSDYIHVCRTQDKPVVVPRNDDVIIVSSFCGDDEAHKDCSRKYKLIQFHTNYRPAYYGTWTRPRGSINPKNPFKMDRELLDYEIDSDDEWVEEELGESISDSEDEDKEVDNPGDESDDEDGFFVPHGYLSNDEGDCSDTGEVIPNDDPHKSKRQNQLDKAWEMEYDARKCQPLHAKKIGCLWINTLPASPSEKVLSKDESFLMQFSALSLVPLPILLAGTAETNPDHNIVIYNSHSELTRQPVPEEAMPDLIRFIHKSPIGVARIIKLFRTHWGARNSTGSHPRGSPPSQIPNGSTTPLPDKSSATPKTTRTPVLFQEYENTSGISKRQLEKKIQAIAVKELRCPMGRPVWYVHDNLMKQYGLDQENFVPLVSNDDSPILCEKRENRQTFVKDDSLMPNTNAETLKRKSNNGKGKSLLIHFLSKSPINASEVSSKCMEVETGSDKDDVIIVEPPDNELLSEPLPKRACLDDISSSNEKP